MSEHLLSNFDTINSDDFLSDLSMNGYGLIALALDKILDQDEETGLTECEEAVIACEIVAAVTGTPSHDFPGELYEWIGVFLAPGSIGREEVGFLREKAADVIDHLVTESELRQLWEDSPEFDAWIATQVELQNRILGD
jgi:hypothetical protein